MKINNINILQEQINLKLENNIKNILKILQDYKGDDWKLYQNNNIKTDYIRNKVYSNKYFEIILISWGPNSKSKIHDHSKNGCAFKVLQGELVEYLYNKKLAYAQFDSHAPSMLRQTRALSTRRLFPFATRTHTFGS